MNSPHSISIALLLMIFTAIQSCRDPEVEQKLDADLRLQVKALHEQRQLDQTISVVFKSIEPLTDLHREVLKKQGIEIMANIGQIYTAKLPARSLYDLAKMRFVESIQGSRQLKIQPPDSSGQIQKF
ncbi:MAG: hypothetical protein ONB13_08750 [candidate division KSB1 bacterium]|nr:hypothetical protein [candidate division KSB1 bacterium]MDZ7333970.1 hypothetical protein [candidate division KSB1 bacterium]MDZ7356766.1 hypothetical protein [candidate division KSB1 bacterium]MDZ7376696.1 hypothetical protein [candidate division KSB1 bacterium]MDZ7399955.1 hypothetical protein [candidate division KSB1 bacterium]